VIVLVATDFDPLLLLDGDVKAYHLTVVSDENVNRCPPNAMFPGMNSPGESRWRHGSGAS
jgi:hypothetical protein